MTQSSTSGIRGTYTGYSIGCAAVWAVILFAAERRLDDQNRNMLRVVCGGWWSGWLSATIARAGYPMPKQLAPESEKRLGKASMVLVSIGLISVIRLLITGKRPAITAADASRD